MILHKMALSVVAAVAALSFTPALHADTHVGFGFGAAVGAPGGGFGFWLGHSPSRHYYPGPVHHPYYYGHPWRPGYIRIAPPPVVVAPPVVVQPAPAVVGEPMPPVVENNVVTVWVTNSNGSKTSVKLTRQGGWYVGPRGEYYDQIPTNEQLRLVYGF